jgi:hypothetical protein
VVQFARKLMEILVDEGDQIEKSEAVAVDGQMKMGAGDKGG